jgi:hypothetical protein
MQRRHKAPKHSPPGEEATVRLTSHYRWAMRIIQICEAEPPECPRVVRSLPLYPSLRESTVSWNTLAPWREGGGRAGKEGEWTGK